MKSHLRMVHKNIKPIICDFCGIQEYSTVDMEKHIKQHQRRNKRKNKAVKKNFVKSKLGSPILMKHNPRLELERLLKNCHIDKIKVTERSEEQISQLELGSDKNDNDRTAFGISTMDLSLHKDSNIQKKTPRQIVNKPETFESSNMDLTLQSNGTQLNLLSMVFTNIR